MPDTQDHEAPSRSFLFHNMLISVLVLLAILFAVPFFLYLGQGFKKKPVDKYHKRELFIPANAQYVQHELMVKYHDGESPQELQDQIAHKSVFDPIRYILTGTPDPQKELQSVEALLKKAHVVRQVLRFHRTAVQDDVYLFYLDPHADIKESMKVLNDSDIIDYAAPNYISTIQAFPDDPNYPQQWDMKKIGLEQAWDIQKGSHDVLVAVIDTGVASTHPDLAGNIQPGKNSVGGSSTEDDMGHGTHVSGTIGAVGNNGLGVTGVNWNVTILAEKVCDSTGHCDDGAVIDGINDAIAHRVQVMNISIAGHPGCANVLPQYQAAITDAINHGIVIVVAAGNMRPDIGETAPVDVTGTTHPADCDGVIAVGAVGPDDKRAFYSYYGSKVAIAAPGGTSSRSYTTDIYSTYPLGFSCPETGATNGYCLESGTSQASPHVAGVAALLFAQYPHLSGEQIKDCILQGADPISTDLPIGGKRLNAYGALMACQNVQAPTATATITPAGQLATFNGRIYYASNNHGYPGVEIDLTGPQGGTKITDPDGKFSFPDLPPGDYSIIVKINGRQIFPNNGSFHVDITRPFSLGLPDNLSGQISVTPDTGSPTSPPNINPTQPSQENTNDGATNIILYDCFEVPESKTVDGKTIQLTRLQCNYKRN